MAMVWRPKATKFIIINKIWELQTANHNQKKLIQI